MGSEHTPGQKQSLENMAALKSKLVLRPHPSITDAFDLAEAELVQIVDGNEKNGSAAEVTRRMFRAVMNAGFMIMHRDEIQDTILVAAQIKTAMEPSQAEYDALTAAAPEMFEALKLAEAILSNAPEFSTTHSGRIPVTRVSEARDVARAALAKAQGGGDG
jgi:hypothetical protein